ncbi:MAG: 3-methyl-2-oxobutanoate hydroxymethyltransferase, partial [Planctomycetota bacterium]
MSAKAKTSLANLIEYKRSGRKFSVLTCYDAPTAGLMESAGVDALLVGDTAAEVVLALPTTRQIRPEFLLELTAAVRRGAPKTFLIGDLPFACHPQHHLKDAIDWSRRCCQQAGADVVKVEVTGQQAPLVEAVVEAGIPVVAHLGLLPQMIDPETGYRAQAKDADSARKLIRDTK